MTVNPNEIQLGFIFLLALMVAGWIFWIVEKIKKARRINRLKKEAAKIHMFLTAMDSEELDNHPGFCSAIRTYWDLPQSEVNHILSCALKYKPAKDYDFWPYWFYPLDWTKRKIIIEKLRLDYNEMLKEIKEYETH